MRLTIAPAVVRAIRASSADRPACARPTQGWALDASFLKEIETITSPLPPEKERLTSPRRPVRLWLTRSEEHTSELQSLMRHSYAVFCLTNTQSDATPHIHRLYLGQ